MKWVAIAILILAPSPTAHRYDDELVPNLDKFCRAFVTWQRVIRAAGHPVTAYTGTGMERRCPNSIIKEGDT